MNRIDHTGVVALRKIGAPKLFTVCGWEVLDDGSAIIRMKEELPREVGERRRWTGPEKTACVTPREVAEEERRFEAQNGRCAKCGGTGEEWAGWSAASGVRLSPCTRCNATGVPATPAPAAPVKEVTP